MAEQKRRGPKPKPQSELAIKNKPDLPGNISDNTEPGDNNKFLRHGLTILRAPEVNLNDIEAVKERINWYFELCATNDVKPSVKGLCNSLRISRQTLLNWKTGTFRDGSYQSVVCQAYDLLESLWEDYMQNGKINPVSGIFLGKNNFGYQDKQEHVFTPGQQMEAVSQDVIEAKYEELPE